MKICDVCGLDAPHHDTTAHLLKPEIAKLRAALEWFADEGHYTDTYRRGAGFVDAMGLTKARAALLGMDPDDADRVEQAWNSADRARKGEG